MIQSFFLRKIVSLALLFICSALLLLSSHKLYNTLHCYVRTNKFFTEIALNSPNQKNLRLNQSFNLFDLGIVDINRDSYLDIFTSNHSAPQSFLVNDGSGHYHNSISELSLDQNPDFPGFEVISNISLSEEDFPGLYIYRSNRSSGIVLNAHNLASGKKISGTISLPYRILVKPNNSFDVNITESSSISGQFQAKLTFTAHQEGSLEIIPANPVFINTPTSFSIDTMTPVKDIYVGVNKVHPYLHDFVLFLRDRHGMAWADYSGDSKIDLFITRGGLKGQLSKHLGIVDDELLLNSNYGFQDQRATFGIQKKGCPGRQTAPVDFDDDGRLDIYVVCGRNDKRDRSGSMYPNQLYQQQSDGKFITDGKFINVASKLGLDIPEMGTFVWLDANDDGQIDFFWENEKEFWLYLNQSGKFLPQLIAANKSGKVGKLTISDYDNDGDIDVFSASDSGNSLVINNGGMFYLEEPEKLGLPEKSLYVSWVDYDNDGMTDLHAIPSGLYHQDRNRKFTETFLMSIHPTQAAAESRCTWFDLNNDGTRDLVLGIRYRIPRRAKLLKLDTFLAGRKDWSLALYRNSYTSSNWLEVELIGMKGNYQAIGSRVVVSTSDGKQLVQQIGQAEGSLYSMGHYRLYFGLGQAEKIDVLSIFWPDGYLQKIREPQTNQLLVLQRNSFAARGSMRTS
jgi:hypothetical protein